jgi:hypothetical protein
VRDFSTVWTALTSAHPAQPRRHGYWPVSTATDPSIITWLPCGSRADWEYPSTVAQQIRARGLSTLGRRSRRARRADPGSQVGVLELLHYGGAEAKTAPSGMGAVDSLFCSHSFALKLAGCPGWPAKPGQVLLSGTGLAKNASSSQGCSASGSRATACSARWQAARQSPLSEA